MTKRQKRVFSFDPFSFSSVDVSFSIAVVDKFLDNPDGVNVHFDDFSSSVDENSILDVSKHDKNFGLGFSKVCTLAFAPSSDSVLNF